MSSETVPRARLGRKHFRVLLIVLLVACAAVVALFGAPLASPFAIAKVTLSPNDFVPVTQNPGFELNDNSWSVATGSPGVASVVSGGAASGNRSLYISDPGQTVSVWYNDSVGRVLPLLINSSTSFGFDLLYKGSVIPEGSSSVWITLFLSWRLMPNDTFPLTMVVGNFSSQYLGSTLDSVNASSGVIMLRAVRAANSWTSYDLQLGTPRVDSLIKAYLQENSSTLYNVGDPIYVLGLRIVVDNAAAYFDNVALYNVVPSVATITLNKPTLLPSSLLGFTASVNGMVQNSTQSYGPTSDTVKMKLDLPLAYNGTYLFAIQTGWGTSDYALTLNDTSLPSWI
jgi:hypothetical protein